MTGRLAVVLLAFAGQTMACALPGGGKSIESPAYSVVYRTEPERLSVGEHFAVELAVCAKGAEALPNTIAVDAWMPEHRHGMNYKAGVRRLGAGRFRAEGLMFHMPGRWEFVFDVGGERLADSVRME
jgi:hypothetical protein